MFECIYLIIVNDPTKTTNALHSIGQCSASSLAGTPDARAAVASLLVEFAQVMVGLDVCATHLDKEDNSGGKIR